MNGNAAGVAFSDRRLVDAYEELRSQVSDGSHHGPGLAIMVTRGFQSWMDCCARLLSVQTPRVGIHERSVSCIPAGLRGEVIVLVAGMLLHRVSGGLR